MRCTASSQSLLVGGITILRRTRTLDRGPPDYLCFGSEGATYPSASHVMKRDFPRWVLWLGAPAIACAWLLATRLVWEQTVWTWKRGEQMVGFSLMHSGVGALLVLAVIASTVWLL